MSRIDSIPTGSPLRFALCCLTIIAMLIILAVLSFRWMWADLNVKYFESQFKKVEQINLHKLELAQAKLDKAAKIRFNDADLFVVAEKYYRLLVVMDKFDFNQLHANPSQQLRLQQALDYAQRALRSRPAAFWQWEVLVIDKMLLQQLDREQEMAFAKALQLGPWAEGTSKRLARFGMMMWQKLNDRNKGHVLDALERQVLINKPVNRQQLSQVIGRNIVPQCQYLLGGDTQLVSSYKKLLSVCKMD